ncbi:MAG: Outer membrane protein assembly factor BamD [Myxococcota bacterium]|nr:Outer membrane protein assembly factor BamD [Myxococcota bacterium]
MNRMNRSGTDMRRIIASVLAFGVFAASAAMAQNDDPPPPPPTESEAPPRLEEAPPPSASKAKPDSGNRDRLSRPVEKYSKDELAELEDMGRVADHLQNESVEYRRNLLTYVKMQYETQRKNITRAYDSRVNELQVEQRLRRDEAITRFEEFIEKYPLNRTYTPASMIRLAELYFEREAEDYSKKFDKYLAELKEAGKEGLEPPPHDMGPIITVYRKLVTNFPDFKDIDAAYYMLGFALAEQGGEANMNEAEKVLGALTSRFPKSRYAPDAWMRLGDKYYNAQVDISQTEATLNKAEACYRKVLESKDYANVDKAMYRIAWTTFRRGKYAEAVQQFTELLEMDERKKKEEGKGTDFRPEAVKSIGICYTDPRWEGAGPENAHAYFMKLGNPPYTGEVLRSIGDQYSERGDAEDVARGVTAYKLAIQTQPDSATAPELYYSLVKLLFQQAVARYLPAPTVEKKEAARMVDEKLAGYKIAFAELMNMSKIYGADWRKRNENNPVAVQRGLDALEKTLVDFSKSFHEQGDVMKQSGFAQLSTPLYRMASSAYVEFLDRFPHSSNSYELAFFLGVSLFAVEDYERAGKQYETVRDSVSGRKYRKEAAFEAVRAYSRLVLQAQEAGRVPKLDQLWTPEERKGQKFEPKTVPAALQRYIDAANGYLRVAPKGEMADFMVFEAAQYYYQYDHLPEARERFIYLIDNYPKSTKLGMAYDLLINTFIATEDWDNVGAWAAKKEKMGVETSGPRNLVQAAIFQKAIKLEKEGKLLSSAREYEKLVGQYPTNENAPDALFNAGLIYEKLKRRKDALAAFEKSFKDYPKSKGAPEALFKVARNSYQFYQYDDAVRNFDLLYNKYPDFKERDKALLQSGQIYALQGDYERGASLYLKYADTYKDKPAAPEVTFEAALLYEKAGQTDRAIRAHESFIKSWGGKQKLKSLQSTYRIAELYKKKGNRKEYERWCNQTLKEYKTKGIANIEVNSANRFDFIKASEAAATCQFEVAEDEFEKFDKMRFSSIKRFEREFTDKSKQLEKAEKEYEKVANFGNPNMIAAAAYKAGYLYDRFAKTLIDAPVPPECKGRGDTCAEDFKNLLEEYSAPIFDKAIKRYKAGIEVVKRAQAVDSPWLQEIEKALAMIDPSSQARQDPVIAFQEDAITNGGVTAESPPPAPPPASAPAPEDTPPPPAPDTGDRVGGGEK